MGPRPVLSPVKVGHLIGYEGQPVYVVADLENFPALKEMAHRDGVFLADHYYDRPAEVLYLRPPLEDDEDDEALVSPATVHLLHRRARHDGRQVH